jgi:transmembrane sensor
MDERAMMHRQSDILEDLALAEAAAWLVRLQTTPRTAATEAAFKAWLAEYDAHAQAFARVTQTWDILPGAVQPYASETSATPARRRPRQSTVAIAAAVACVVLTVVLNGFLGPLWGRDSAYRTAIGETRTLTLDDGSHVTLNTDTQLMVAYRAGERRIRLEHGEALFEVAPNPQRPFIVQAADHQVRALGTIFDVRSDAQNLAVILIKGQVEVSGNRAARSGGGEPAATVLMSPGERMVVNRNGEAHLDHPEIETLTAWQRGQAIFDDVALADAIAEINRYGGARVQLGDPALGQLRISGVFATRNSAEFAAAVAKLHHLNVAQSGNVIALER